MASRVLAVIAALGMIAGAYVYRYGAPGDGGSSGGSGRDETAGAVICASELGEVCDAVRDAEVEPAAATAERLIAASSGSGANIRAWVAPGPWAEMVDAARGSRPPLFEETEVVATTPLVIVTRKVQPIPGCGGAITWRCLGDAAQDPEFRLAADADTTPAGLFTRAAALGGFLDTTDYPINDLDEVPEASSWLSNLDRNLDRARSFGAGSLAQFLIKPGAANGYLTTGAGASAAATRPDIELSVPAPAAIVPVIVARTAGEGAAVDEERLRVSLQAGGWDVGPPPTDDGLPSPGVLIALRGRLE